MKIMNTYNSRFKVLEWKVNQSEDGEIGFSGTKIKRIGLFGTFLQDSSTITSCDSRGQICRWGESISFSYLLKVPSKTLKSYYDRKDTTFQCDYESLY